MLWAALVERKCFEGELQILEPHALSQLLCELWRADNAYRPPERLVWTLPEALHVEGVTVDGYVREAVRLVSGAKQRLLIVTPYLEPRGLGLLQAPLLDALHRGAEVTLLTHDAQDMASLAATAVEPLRRESRTSAGTFLVYTAAPTAGALLHLKVVVADGAQAVVGSANVTGRGFGENLEVGALLGRDAADEIERIVRAVIQQGLALPVFVRT